MKGQVFWGTTPCWLVNIYRCAKESWCLYLQVFWGITPCRLVSNYRYVNGSWCLYLRVFWSIMLCRLVNSYRYVEGSCCLYLQAKAVQFYCSLWRLSHYKASKRRKLLSVDKGQRTERLNAGISNACSLRQFISTDYATQRKSSL